MDKNDYERIYTIKRYCEDITRTIKRFGESAEIFINDYDYYNSISMSLMQIGEISAGLSDKFKLNTISKIPWDLIKGMRNHFAHGYASMEKSDIWETAVNDIPDLLNFCEYILETVKK